MITIEELQKRPVDFPLVKKLSEATFGYLMPLTFNRYRINVAPFADPMMVTDFY